MAATMDAPQEETAEYFYCGATLTRPTTWTRTCNRRVAHKGSCSPHLDRPHMSDTFNDAWAAYFAARPEIQASWNHQNDRLPPGWGLDDD